MKRLLIHAIADLAVIALILGIPLLLSGRRRQADAVSGASLVVEAPSGTFLVLLNHDRLQEDGFWERFFSGQEVDFCFEDITCAVPENDPAALEMARSFQSRLSEHQMTVRQEDPTLLLSKADHGRFQVIVLSAELAEHYRAQTAVHDGVTAIRTGQEGNA